MDKRLYTMRFRQGMKGVVQGFLEVPAQADLAEEKKLAERIGKQYCDIEPGRRFITAELAILADESILPAPKAVPATEPSAAKKAKAS